jgi:hypothetical protein
MIFVVPLVASTVGTLMGLAGAVLAAAGDEGTDLAPYVGGVGNGIAVVGLVFVLRAVLSGNLVARPVAEVEAKLISLTEASHRREEAFEDIAGRMGFASVSKGRRPHDR